MKPAAILIVLVIVLAAVFWPEGTEKNQGIPLAIATTKSRTRIPSKDAPFWNSAIVPEPPVFREPTTAPLPQAKLPQVDHPREVARLQHSGDVAALNFALAAWFTADAAATRDWLAAQENLNSYQPALTMIAGKIAEAGDPAHALEWAALLTPGPEQEQSVFDIYALAARSRRFSEAELRAAPLPPARVDELLSGAAGD
ncbi:MAG: hypothetical protein B9S35_15210 [Opitutia bacterium Tous-C5TDCM]|nr:MAG: hypothetical protein B9S35_15210 [Opitutae bacterium Tous-C5TDCM]